MAKIPGVNHLNAVRALEKAGFWIQRQGKHIVMTDGTRILTIPRNNPINAYTMAGIVRDAGLTIDQFLESFYKKLANNRLKLTARLFLAERPQLKPERYAD